MLDLTGTVQGVDSAARSVVLLLATGETIAVSFGPMMRRGRGRPSAPPVSGAQARCRCAR